jgi:integrase
MASITEQKLKGGKRSFNVRIRINGRALSGTFPAREEAERWAAEREKGIQQGYTFRGLVDRYRLEVLPDKRMHTQVCQEQQLCFWEKHLGALPLSEVTASGIASAMEALSGRKPATVNSYRAVLSHVFSMAVYWGWIPVKPVIKAARMPTPDSRVRFLVKAECARVLTACRQISNPYLYAIVRLALSTGARKEEIRTLAWSEIDLQRGRIYLSGSMTPDYRTLPLYGETLEVMKELAARNGTNPFCFPSRDGDKPLDFRASWEAALKQAGVKDFRFHDLRGMAASYMAMNGIPMEDIARILGVKSVVSVQRFESLREPRLAAAVEKMNRAIFDE